MIYRKGLRFRAWWVVLWLIMVSTVVVGSLLPSNDLPPMWEHMDKVLHFGGYFVLTLVAASIFRGRFLVAVALAMAVLGGLIEVAQGAWTTTRAADMKDFYVDLAGVVVGYTLARTPLGNLLVWFEQVFFGSDTGSN